MVKEIQEFIRYMHEVKLSSRNTELSYERDLRLMSIFFQDRGIHNVEELTSENLNTYILYLEQAGKKPSTVSRTVAAIKAFSRFLSQTGYITEDIAATLKAPKIERKEQVILSAEDTRKFLEQPGQSPKELRDRAMLELLHATGIRVSELITLEIKQLDLNKKCITINNKKSERTIQLGEETVETMSKYLQGGRPYFVNAGGSEWLFTNCAGQEMSRQGFWKIVKFYGKKAGIEVDITPYILKHTFIQHSKA